MKVNKKVFAAALALSMRLGAIAPATNALADTPAPITTTTTTTTKQRIDKDKYLSTGQAWLLAYKNLKQDYQSCQRLPSWPRQIEPQGINYKLVSF